MEMLLELLQNFLISTGIGESIDSLIREFFQTFAQYGEVMVISTFFILFFIRFLQVFIGLFFMFLLIKFGIIIL